MDKRNIQRPGGKKNGQTSGAKLAELHFIRHSLQRSIHSSLVRRRQTHARGGSCPCRRGGCRRRRAGAAPSVRSRRGWPGTGAGSRWWRSSKSRSASRKKRRIQQAAVLLPASSCRSRRSSARQQPRRQRPCGKPRRPPPPLAARGCAGGPWRAEVGSWRRRYTRDRSMQAEVIAKGHLPTATVNESSRKERSTIVDENPEITKRRAAGQNQ